MKKGLMALAAAGAVAMASAAYGQAVVIQQGTCNVVDAAGNSAVINDAGGGGDAVVQSVLSGNEGKAKLTCNGTLPGDATLPGEGGLPSKAVLYDFDSTGGAPCVTDYGSTEDWHMVVTKGGRVALTCHVTLP